jgi:S-adenosylmethionine/arginine decarboxylase-like enzyme
MANGFWGWHLSLDCGGCDVEAMTDARTIYDFNQELVEKIDMVAYGEPRIVNFGSGNKMGYTLDQLIETSNICAHFANDERAIYLDVFSCKPFDPEVVKALMVAYFGAQGINELYRTRVAPTF